jgi:hypothetical protein
MQRQPMASLLQPFLHDLALAGVGIRAGDIRDQQPTDWQPLPDVSEIIADRRWDAGLRQQG